MRQAVGGRSRARRLVSLALLAACVGPARADYDYVSYDYGYIPADGTNPRLVSNFPVDGATEVPLDTAITVTFSEKVVLGAGQIVLLCPVDLRRFPASDVQVTIAKATNLTLVLRPAEILRSQAVYDVVLNPAVVMDHAGNNFQGGRFQFRTTGRGPNLLVFAPYIQAPDSPVMFAFRTGDQCLYGSSTDEYRLLLRPSATDVFHVPAAGIDGMENNCARVVEVSRGFPAIDSCKVRGGRFEIALRESLSSVSEYSLVVQWPVLASPANSTEVHWELSISRAYNGIFVEVQRFHPWRHRFGDYLLNNVDDTRGAVVEFSLTPVPGAKATEWLGPDTMREFLVRLRFGSPGLLPGSRILLFATPYASWSTNPSLPLNMTLLQLLTLLDPFYLSDTTKRGSPCLHFFPGDLPYSTRCRHLELGLSGYSYGLELELPTGGIGAPQTAVNRAYSFTLFLPGAPQPLALVAHWEAILLQAAASRGELPTQSMRRKCSHPVVLNTTEGMSLRVLSNDYPYTAPVGTRVNRVEIEFMTGSFVLGLAEVYIELLEPSRARVEACEAVAGAPRISVLPPAVTDEPFSRITWVLQPMTSGGGPRSYVAYPHTRYRTACLIYNGPHSAPRSHWRLGVASLGPTGRLESSRTFSSSAYFVATVLAGAQVTPTLPLLGREQLIFVRVTLPIDDGITLRHWTAPARRLQLVAPAGFRIPVGECTGFRPLSSSSLPPTPLTGCRAKVGFQVIEVTIDAQEPGFEPGHTYAFRTVVGNPDQWEEVQSREVGGIPVPRANQWSLSILRDDGHPLALIEDIPSVYSTHTAALRPDSSPMAHDTSFRVYQRPLLIHSFSAENTHLGRMTRVFFRFSLSTPLRLADILQVTAPSGFAWAYLNRLEQGAQILQGATPFPSRGMEVKPASWIARVILGGEAAAATPYGLVLNVTNPSAWSSLDQELNFWMLETYYDFGGILDRRSRRDVAVRQGYVLTGELKHCRVVPASRANGQETWVSLTLKLSTPVFSQSWSQSLGPSQLQIKAPNGFHFAVKPEGGNCTGLLLAEAFSDSPPLPTAHFPHGYSPLADLSGFECTLDTPRLETARTVIIKAMQKEGFGLLPHLLYAFQLRVVNPVYDRIFDTQWVLKTLDHAGDVAYEECIVHSLPSLEPALAALAQVEGADTQPPLPTQQTAVTLEFSSASPIAASTGPKTMVVSAPPGYVFLRHRAALGGSPPQDGSTWTLLSADARGAVATLLLHLNRTAAPLVLTLYARLPSRIYQSQPLAWSVSVLEEPVGYQTAGLLGSAARVMQQFTIQPVGIPFFRVRSSAQQAVLTIAPSADVPVGGVLEVRGPRHESFTFDPDSPCEALREDPEVLGPDAVRLTVVGSSGLCSGSGGASSGGSGTACEWPLVSSCVVSHWGTRLTIAAWRALRVGVAYCFQVRLTGPAGRAGAALPSSASLRSEAGASDLAPAAVGDGGEGWGVAPFVREVAHLSLCYGSRVPASAPRELTVRFVPSSLGISSAGAAAEGRICFDGATLAADGGSAVCRIYEPVFLNLSGVEGGDGTGPSCDVLPVSHCRGVCVALRGKDLWASSRRVVLSVPVKLSPGIVPHADFQIFDAAGSVMQGSTASLDLPVLNRLASLGVSAPRTASTAAAFPVTLSIDWVAMGVAFLENLVEVEEEEIAFLDVSAPPGLTISLACRPVACYRLSPGVAAPRHGMRLVLGEAASATSWWRRLRQGRRLAGRSFAASGPSSGMRQCGRGRACSSSGAACCTPAARSRSLLASHLFNASALPPEIQIYVTAVHPLTPLASNNVWDFVLRSPALRALGAVEVPGFGVAGQMEVRLEASSQIAGDVFSRLTVTLLLEAPLSTGDAIVLLPPSPEIPCRTETAEPADLLGPSTAAIPHLFPGSCALELRQPLRARVRYSLSMALPNPPQTPQPNVWLVQTFSKAASTSQGGATTWEAHSVADAVGFEVFGEFSFFHVLAKSAAPEVFTPAAIHFQLRTPFPDLPVATASPRFEEPVVRLRIAVLNGSSLARVAAFDPGGCLMDFYASSELVEPVADAEVLQPDDCLVTDGGAAVEFLFGSAAWGRRAQSVWTRLRNPTMEASLEASWTYEASTFVKGSPHAVHRASVRPTPLLGLQAVVTPGSRAASAAHRATVSILAGKIILGQRGAIEVTLPSGFEGSCGAEHFRPRPALPETARCRGFQPSGSRGGLIVVYWRTLFRTGGLRPPYEFSFELINANLTMTDLVEGPRGAWHIRIFEGENRELLVDGTPRAGLRPFDLCPALTLSHRREDKRIVSVVFNASEDLPDGFENLVRVELRSSARAPAMLACPETSIWRRRPDALGAVQGLPEYTTCVLEPPERAPPIYEDSAHQYLSAVLFLLPFERFRAGEKYGLEVVMERIPERAQAGLSSSEAAAELLGLQLESHGVLRECGSVPLGSAVSGGVAVEGAVPAGDGTA